MEFEIGDQSNFALQVKHFQRTARGLHVTAGKRASFHALAREAFSIRVS